MTRADPRGFTLVELLLAMTLLSFVMMIATVGFVGINRTYNRGMIRKELSEYAQLVTEDITRAIRAGSADMEPFNCNGSGAGCSTEWSAVCLDNVRYIWSRAGDSSGLRKDRLPQCADDPAQESTELLSTRYRVRALEVNRIQGGEGTENLYRVRGLFSTKEDAALNISATDPFNVSCKGTAQSAFAKTCTVEKFSFIVNARGGSLGE